MLVSFLRVLILYPIVIFGIRLMGKRQIGELQPTELVVTILISNIATLPIEDQNLPLLAGILPMLTLICCEVLMSWGVLRHPRLRKLLSGTPQVVIRGGEIDQNTMRELRFSVDDLMTALRGKDIFDPAEVQLALVETNGKLSVYQKAEAQPLTRGDMQVNRPDETPPEVIVADGCVRDSAVRALGLARGTLDSWLRQKGLRLGEVFLMTADGNGLRTVVKKEPAV
jgi:uncharacterized membrane protein YcaP (DUF421 family)